MNQAHPNTVVSEDWLDHDQLKGVLAAADLHFKRIREKYPTLKAYSVLWSSGGQAETSGTLEDMLVKFPAMLAPCPANLRMREFLQTADFEHASDSKKKQLQLQLKKLFEELAPQLRFDLQCRIELCFVDLDYDLVWKLQTDDLVDRHLTPHTKASIRIVLGTLSRFIETKTTTSGEAGNGPNETNP